MKEKWSTCFSDKEGGGMIGELAFNSDYKFSLSFLIP